MNEIFMNTMKRSSIERPTKKLELSFEPWQNQDQNVEVDANSLRAMEIEHIL